MSKAALL